MQIDFRDSNEVDRPQIAKWIENDPCPQHQGVSPDFWLPDGQQGTKCITVMNEGRPLFYLRLENVMRCYIQFPPDAERDPIETKAGLQAIFLTVSRNAKGMGYHEMIFDSKSEGLINLFKKFGFKAAEDNWLVRL